MQIHQMHGNWEIIYWTNWKLKGKRLIRFQHWRIRLLISDLHIKKRGKSIFIILFNFVYVFKNPVHVQVQLIQSIIRETIEIGFPYWTFLWWQECPLHITVNSEVVCIEVHEVVDVCFKSFHFVFLLSLSYKHIIISEDVYYLPNGKKK